jgi:hypothetical protein
MNKIDQFAFDAKHRRIKYSDSYNVVRVDEDNNYTIIDERCWHSRYTPFKVKLNEIKYFNNEMSYLYVYVQKDSLSDEQLKQLFIDFCVSYINSCVVD